MTNSTVKSLQELGLCSGKRGKSPRKVNILIVDDNPDDLLSLEHILSKLGHNLIKANSKEVALSYLLKQEFAVILLDINIPGIKEIVTDKYIKQQWKNQHTPIIFLTTFSDRQPVIFNDLTIGTVDYLYKPIVPEMLISKVSVFTNLFQKTLELAQAEEALLSCGVRLCGILDNSSDAVISVDSTQLIKIFNKEAEKIFGYTASDVLGQPLGILLLETNEKLQYIFESFHVDKSDYNTGERCEMIGRRKDGTEFPCVVSMFPLELVSGKVLTVVLRDVSDRKAAEAALRQTETNFPAFMNHSPLLCWMTDRNGKFIYCNKSFEHWYERSPSEVIGKTIFDLYPPEIAQQRLNYIKYVTSTGQVLETNESLSCPNGKSCELLIYQFPLFDTDGQTLVGGVAIDMSERKQLEEALRESERRFRAIFEQTYQLTTILKPDGTVEDANRSALESIGFFDTEVIGKPFWQTQWWKTSPEVQHRLQRAIQQAVKGKLVRYEVQVKGSDDKIATIDFSLKPLKDEFGNVTQLIAEGRDITDIKQAQQALQEANAQLNNWVKELKTRNREIALLGQLSDILQACLSIEEAHKVLARLVQPLFPDVSGAVFVLNHSDNVLEAVAMWGNASATTELIFEPKECWGLRRGRLHLTDTTSLSMACEHSKQQDSSQFQSLCVPMMAQGEALGVLYLCSLETEKLTDAKQQLALTAAEHIAVGLANIKLHEVLKQQSICDPLTGLFNRRYLEESLEREIHRSKRQHFSIGIIMLDIDHFKRFNDTFGHDAGDIVLQELGAFLKKNVRDADVACRYGGEEMILVLPEASLETTLERAELVREGVKHLVLQHRHQYLGTITISLGVACYPKHGTTAKAVVKAADNALYRAKQAGRDRVISASTY